MADENACPQAWGGAVARELRKLAARPPPGVKLLLRDDDLTDVTAIIEGPAETPYAGGVFRVRVSLGAGYPARPPRAVFATRIFHPNVSAAGEVCVNTLARDWRPELGLAHALQAVRCLLIAPNPDSALNAEAAALLRDRYDDYAARAKLYTEIHARPGPGDGAAGDRDGDEGPSAKRPARPAAPAPAPAPAHAGQRPAPARAAKDKRRILKRL